MSDEVLNLDHQGETSKFVIRSGAKLYTLKRLNELGPTDLDEFRKLQSQLRYARLLKGNNRRQVGDESRAQLIEQVVHGVFKLICPELLADNPPFVRLMAALRYYLEQSGIDINKAGLANPQRGGRRARARG